MKSHLLVLGTNFWLNGVLLRESFLIPVSYRAQLFFLLSISAFHISHLELNFMQGGLDLISLFYMWAFSFPSTIYWKFGLSLFAFDTSLNTDGCVICIYIWVSTLFHWPTCLSVPCHFYCCCWVRKLEPGIVILPELLFVLNYFGCLESFVVSYEMGWMCFDGVIRTLTFKVWIKGVGWLLSLSLSLLLSFFFSLMFVFLFLLCLLIIIASFALFLWSLGLVYFSFQSELLLLEFYIGLIWWLRILLSTFTMENIVFSFLLFWLFFFLL